MRKLKQGNNCLIMLLTVIILQYCCYGASIAADKVLYDDFSGQYLDPVKWTPLESVIKVDNGKLVSQLGAKTNSGGSNWSGADQAISFVNPDTIHSIKATVTIQQAIFRDSTTTQAGARIGGVFYQTSDGPCYAEIGIAYNNQSKQFNVWYHIQNNVAFLNDGFQNSLTFNTPSDLKLDYNESTNTFTFTFNGTSKSVVGFSRTGALTNSNKQLNTTIWNDQYNNGVSAFVATTFENVYVNDTLYDDFSTAPLDGKKWNTPEVVRKIEDGKLNIYAHNAGQVTRTRVILSLTETQPKYIEAEFTVNSDSWFNNGAYGTTRVDGIICNDTYGPGSGKDYNGWLGEIFVAVGIRVNADRTLVAYYDLERSDDVNFNTSTVIWSGNFSTAINFDTPVILGFSFDVTKKQLIAKCNDETKTFTTSLPIYPAHYPGREVQSRGYAGQGKSSYMMADVDNVYISNDLVVTPSNQNVSRYAGTTSFTVSNQGEETLPWTAKVISGGSWLKITSGASGTNSGTITCAFDPNLSYTARTGVIRVTASGVVDSTQDVTVTQAGKAGPYKHNIWGVWSEGVYSWNQATNKWTKFPYTSGIKMVAAGDVDGDGIDDMISVWSSGLWVKYSSTGKWVQFSKALPNWIAAGDLNNDGKADVIGSWTGDAVYYRDSATGKWIKVADTPAKQLAVGDITGSGKDELVSVWSTGVWVRSSATGTWQKIDGGVPTSIAAGDMSGDYRSDIIGSYATGTWYRDSATGKWYSMAFSAEQLATGDLNGDGFDDLIGVWPGGLYVRYGSSGNWQLVTTSKPIWITTAKASSTTQALDFNENSGKTANVGPGGDATPFVYMNTTGPGTN